MSPKPSKNPRKRKLEFTVFQSNSFFRGILNFAKPLQILGRFEGEIYGSADLEIGSSARIEAHINTTRVVIYGHVTGNVAASEKVELRSGATLIGNIRSPNLEIDDGVVFEGQCEMQPEQQQAQTA